MSNRLLWEAFSKLSESEREEMNQNFQNVRFEDDDPLESLPEDLSSLHLSDHEMRSLFNRISQYNRRAENQMVTLLQSPLGGSVASKMEMMAAHGGETYLDFAKTVHSTISLYLAEHRQLSLEMLLWSAEIFEKHHEFQWLAMTLKSAAKMSFYLHNEEDAKSQLNQCRKVLRKVGDWNCEHMMDSESRFPTKISYEADVLCELARVQMHTDVEKAEQTFRECFDLINKVEYGAAHFKAYVDYAEYCTERGWTKEGMKILKKCLVKVEADESFRLTCDADDREDAIMNINLRLGEASLKLKNYERGEHYYRQALRYEGAISRRGSIVEELQLHCTLVLAIIAQSKFKAAKKMKRRIMKKIKSYERQDRPDKQDCDSIRKLCTIMDLQMDLGKKMGKIRWEKEGVPEMWNMVYPDREKVKAPKHVRVMHRTIAEEQECANCGEKRPMNTLLTCKRCKKVLYCSRECQKAHWKIHKIESPQCAKKRAV